ncbi:GntR family transcriptional regulator [Nakamurella lactea]|uniref:GntR family transcriptional regulator n=1 Tax=Nakamurella lactea TaxID=459515 RepID=UPI00040B2778|nr:GntR family transcriptional regulator [Nakamurella lactea]
MNVAVDASGDEPEPAGSKSELVYQWLRSEVGNGNLRPADRVNADRVSRELEVSKVPVREAIARLAAERVLLVSPNAGAVVAPLSWRELADIQQARLVLEPPTAASAAGNATKARIGELRVMITGLRRWARTHDGDPFAMNRSFHLALVALAGNELLTEMLDLVLQRVSRYRMIAQHTSASVGSTAREHAAIVDALADGDGPSVQRLLSAHLQSTHSVTGSAHEVDPRYFVDEPDEQRPMIC